MGGIMNNPETKQAAERLRACMTAAWDEGSIPSYEDIDIILDALADRDSRLAEMEKIYAGAVTFKELLEANKARELAEQQLAAAQRSAEDARRDSARLDWLANPSSPLPRIALFPSHGYYHRVDERRPSVHEDLRGQIDRAISELAAMSAAADGLSAKDRAEAPASSAGRSEE
jgi:hypothetical protein